MDALRRSLSVIALVAAVALSSACRDGNVRGPFRNRYLDAETRQPISGVVFLAVWHTIRPNLVSGPSEPFYEAREVVSGADGRVEIPRLTGPVFRFGLDVRFYDFAPGGYVNERAQVTPPDAETYVNPTVTFMKKLKTHEARCEAMRRPSLIPSAVGAAPIEKMRVYMTALNRESDQLNCGSLNQE